jgi:hypothetical protein
MDLYIGFYMQNTFVFTTPPTDLENFNESWNKARTHFAEEQY